MHNDLNSFMQNPTQNFCKNLINFEKSQNLSKTPKVSSKRDECMINERKRIILEKEKGL